MKTSIDQLPTQKTLFSKIKYLLKRSVPGKAQIRITDQVPRTDSLFFHEKQSSNSKHFRAHFSISDLLDCR